MTKSFILALSFTFLGTSACGVKGRPLPPQTPREIGIGKPLYKGVDKEMNESKKKKDQNKAEK